jgi:formylglycine-generating enzyme required for sulfatase activity
VYTVTYYANGATGIVPSWSVNPGESVTISAGSGLSKISYAVDGWSTSADGAGTAYQAGASYTLQADINLYAQWVLDMATIPARSGTFPNGGAAFNTAAFKIARYETTYELWYEVKTWADVHGYTFANLGREGADGHSGDYVPVSNTGTPPRYNGTAPSDDKFEPVTYINWFDTLAWCNAYSEMTGKTQVYTFDGAILKDAAAVTAEFDSYANSGRDWANESGDEYTARTRGGMSAVIARIAVNAAAKGYRLPTVDEWMLAARGGDPADTVNWNYAYSGSDNPDEVGWYSGHRPNTGTTPVGALKPNSLGIYDMTGNVEEWCWDYRIAGETHYPHMRYTKGGGWQYLPEWSTNAYAIGSDANSTFVFTGFRVVCSP